ncbi:MAG TPA: MFS transporter [Anaerolineae bacterium]|nr:MFS transporter [Anaerolineae bacterium]
MSAAAGNAPRATRREWIGLAVIALPCLLYSMDLTVLNLAVPSLSADLKPSGTQLLWIVDIYGFLVAGSLITMGTLGDRIGRRRLLLIGAGAFGVASVFAALSTSAGMLIASRALMGVAGATLAPSTLSLIFNMFRDPGQRAVAIGVWISSFSAGGAIGPVLGGVLLEYFWWGSVFLLALPVMGLLLLLGPRVLPEYRDPEARRLDLRSAAMSLTAILAVIYGLKQTAQDGFGALPAASTLAGLTIGLLFLRRQRRLADPLIDLRLFRIPTFSVSLATNVLAVFVAFGYFVFVAQYLQLVLGLSPLNAGLWSLPSSVGFIVGSNVSPRFVHRFRPALVLGGSLALAALALVLLSQISGANGLAVVVAASVVISLALSPVFTLTTELIVGSAPPERAGVASGISETGAELGGALGIAILGSIGAAVYRSAVANGLPAGVPSEAATIALDTLGGAVGVAQQLPGPLGVALLDLAREAFVQGLNLAAGISAAVAIGAAIMAVVFLHRVPAGAEHEQEPDLAPNGAAAGGVALDKVLNPTATAQRGHERASRSIPARGESG